MEEKLEGVTIIRAEHNRDNPYVIMDKRIFEDESLSWRAKGLLGYLLSRPDNWRIIVGDLIKRSTEGRDAVRATLRELSVSGYLCRERRHNADGLFEWVYIVYESPSPEKPSTVKPSTVNRPLLSIDLNNNENTNMIGVSPEETPTPTQETFNLVMDDSATTDVIVAEDSLLFDAINQDRHANGQRNVRVKFDTLQQKARWRVATTAAQRLFNGKHGEVLAGWINVALEKGIRNKAGIIAYVAKIAENQADRRESTIKVY